MVSVSIMKSSPFLFIDNTDIQMIGATEAIRPAVMNSTQRQPHRRWSLPGPQTDHLSCVKIRRTEKAGYRNDSDI